MIVILIFGLIVSLLSLILGVLDGDDEVASIGFGGIILTLFLVHVEETMMKNPDDGFKPIGIDVSVETEQTVDSLVNQYTPAKTEIEETTNDTDYGIEVDTDYGW
jgi:hypothetical protein